MNKYIKPLVLMAALGLTMASCLEEFTPTSSATQEQVNNADKSGLSNAVAAYMTTYSSSYYYDIGFSGFGIWRDVMTADCPIVDAGWDYFSYPGTCMWLGSNYELQYLIWKRYYALVQKANLVAEACDKESTDDRPHLANALAYRANAYFEMAQWYEFRHTGFATLDQVAESEGIIGLTVPIVTEKTTEAQSRNNPRTPFYTIYRFILDDLNSAEECLSGGIEPMSSMANANLAVIYGLKARVWLYLGTRFALHPEDLATVLEHEDDQDIEFAKLGVTTDRECFVKAAAYAREAINQGYTPITESQWFDPTTGFNTPTSSWMWAVIITTDNGLATSRTWSSFVSFMSPEPDYGLGAISVTNGGGAHMIDARLFSSISDGDWRRPTWIAPEDVANEEAFNSTYARGTNLGYSEWSRHAAYCGFKFHPNAGERNTSTTGNAISLPLMRVEEMYFIEAEATARTNGVEAGRQLLESFMNSFRMKAGSTYESTGVGLDGFIEDLLTQKRIEFWGEGLILWDFRRLETPIIRGYEGTNHPTTYRFNSLPGAVAPWSTLSLPNFERDYNRAVILNPDPSYQGNYSLWEE